LKSYSGYNYVSHDPTYEEPASYNLVRHDSEAGLVISNMTDLARAEVIILSSMLSKESNKQHMGAEKLRLATKMGSHDTNEFIEAVLHPLLTYIERFDLRIMLPSSDSG
jgi:hypothetical protein